MAAATPLVVKQEIISLYNSGYSIARIYRTIKVSEPTISKILKAAGIEIKKDNYQSLHLDTAKIIELYTNGMNTYAIGKLLNCSDETIRKIVNVRDIKIRNKRGKETIDKIRSKSLELWQNEDYVQAVKNGTNTDEYKQALSRSGVKIWASPEYRTKMLELYASSEYKHRLSENSKKMWEDPEYRAKQEVWYGERNVRLVKAFKASIQDPEKRARWIDKIRANAPKRILASGRISYLQKQLYYILNISGITYIEEGVNTTVGPFYVVDCVIPVQQHMVKPLIIEVQGEYWHNIHNIKVRDKQKATYIRNNTNYDLLTIWELDMASYEQVIAKLATYGLTVPASRHTVHDIIIKQITEHEAKMFYSVFHYTSTIRSGAKTFGAFVNGELIAAVSYTYPLRVESATRLGYALKEVMEISRLARRTDVVCKNLISFLLSKTIRTLDKNIRCIISFSDSTYNHTGSAYAASNFSYDGDVEPDYFYISGDGRFHKKTVWNMAKKRGISESEYANIHGLVKFFGGPKKRWVYRR